MTDNRDQFVPDSPPETGDALYVSFEKKAQKQGPDLWVLGLSDGETFKTRTIHYRDYDQLADMVGVRARDLFGLTEDYSIYSVSEMGREGFSLYRKLVERGFKHLPIDAASLATSRRKKRAKTDRIDADKLVRELVRYIRGDDNAFSAVNVPSPHFEDRREVCRERKTLVKERTAHINRMRALLFKHGIDRHPNKALPCLDDLTTSTGKPLGKHLKTRLRREYERYKLVNEQIEKVQADQREVVKNNKDRKAARMVIRLSQLRAIGITTAYSLVYEAFGWREFANRKEVKAFFGVDPTPFESASKSHQQGISKRGNSQLRELAVETAWNWQRFQKDSELTGWYLSRWDGENKGTKLSYTVAMAAKLMNRLRRFATRGEVPNGAVMKTAPPITLPPSA